MFASHALTACVAELRSSWRRVRTFVFVAVAATGIVSTLVLASLATGQVAPLAGAYAPRFVLSAVGSAWLWLFMIAAVFLGFDARQQDERARVAEVLDARPVSNLALLCGRLMGTILVAWLSLAAIALAIQGVGTVGRIVHEASGSESATVAWRLAVAVEPVSLGMLLTVDAVPALAFAAALATFLAAAFRRRALTVLVALTLIAVHIYAVANTPMSALSAISFVTSYADFASDILPTYPDVPTLVQRAALLLFAAALLLGAAALGPRADDRSGIRRGMVAILLTALGVAGLAGVVAHAASDSATRRQWLTAQEAARGFVFPDIRHVRGEIRIEPGEELALDLELRVAAATGTSLDRLYFTLNPGMAVHAVEIGGEPAEMTRGDGILAVELRETLSAGAEVKLTLRASGVPDGRFAYLDSAVDWRRLPASNALVLLGTDALVFARTYVALMAAAAWLPTAGPNLADRAPDAYTADLTVQVPETWLVAGPGRREAVRPGVFRFRPGAAVADVALFAARFERRAVETAGVMLELLVVPEHAGHLDGLGEVMAGENGIIARVGDMLDEAKRRGLPYPLSGFGMVEVPARLRGYGGGRQLDTVLFPPGLALVREYGFPTRFERAYLDRANFLTVPKRSTETADRKQGTLYRLFRYEAAGGGLHHVARHVFPVRGAAEVPGSIAVDALTRVLAVGTVWQLYRTGSNPPFTTHRFAAAPAVRTNPLRSLVWGGGPSRLHAADRPAVWEAAERTALTDLGVLDNAGLAMDVLRLRVDHAANALRDRYGLDKAGAMLADLRRATGGTSFDLDAFKAASARADMDVEALLGDWLNATGMPGFRVSAVDVFRIPDGDDGKPRYQVLVNVRNSEPVPGLVRLTYAVRLAGTVVLPEGVPSIAAVRPHHSPPIPVAANSAVRVGRILEQPPEAVWLQTYLSRNRGELYLPVPDFDTEKVVAGEPLTDVEPSDWQATDRGIVVDDLDDGFQVESTVSATRLGGAAVPNETDRGLPVYRRAPQSGWARQQLPTAWGRYRRTVVRIVDGEGSSRVAFDAELPEQGRWQLSYHVPSLRMVGLGSEAWGPADEVGTHRLDITSTGVAITVDFDAAAAVQGWNRIDVFDLPGGVVRVAVSDVTSGRSVVADAVRWERVHHVR
ncbi:MAG: hypothetical protein OXG82_19430 [Gammaproteobacteria bacterium]|nr:hypothetical protein [Gammaproteobacteria bacterium]